MEKLERAVAEIAGHLETSNEVRCCPYSHTNNVKLTNKKRDTLVSYTIINRTISQCLAPANMKYL